MASVFRALADPNRRELLDRLFERDGQTLGELSAALPGMTRFGVMKHLGILEGAGLISTQRTGREKRHYLDPVPIRLVHDRWTGKFAASIVGSMTALKRHLEASMDTVDHVYSVYIKAPPERVWRAIVDGDETVRYYYGTRVASTWDVGAPITYTYDDGSVAADGVRARDRPGAERRDVVPSALGPGHRARRAHPDDLGGRGGPAAGLTKLTVTSALTPGSRTEGEFSGGVVYIVSGLKTALETGEPLAVA